MNMVIDYGQLNPQRVDAFFDKLFEPTGLLFEHHAQRSQVIDERIRVAQLTLAEKIEAFKRLAPRVKDNPLGAITGKRKELRMERLLHSIAPEELPLFKFALEYDGDYKDMEEYIYHDIDDQQHRNRVIEHLKKSNQLVGIKVLTDVDDTMYANLIEQRYPKKTFYPGVVEFYDALKREPFQSEAIPITTLSARPNPIAGLLEEASLKSLVKLTDGRLLPSALSGKTLSAALGTLQTKLRAGQEEIDLLFDENPEEDKSRHEQEDKIGEVKFENFMRFSAIYPEYRFVFVGDSGQADALTARKMLTETSPEVAFRVVTTFIHDLRQTESDESAASHAFKKLHLEFSSLLVNEASATGRGVIVFRNYISAAVTAFKHSATLDNLISPEDLAKITKAALEQFQGITFDDKKQDASLRLSGQYREDAEEAYQLLTEIATGSPDFDSNVTEIRSILNKW